MEEPAGAFAHTLRGEGIARDLWPYLLGLATLLLPFDVGVRRLALGRRDLEKARAWVMEQLLRRRRMAPSPAGGGRGEGVPSPVGRLFKAKSRAGERRPAAGDTPSVERPPAPAPPPRPVEPTPAPPAAEGGTLAGRLLERKRERE